MKRILSSESVTIGHPDKICDQISDAILDEILTLDKEARVACDVAVNTGLVLVMGEITTECYVDISETARRVIRDIGYTSAEYGFDCDSCAVLTSIDKQSPDISLGVTRSQEYGESGDIADLTGAGDQGMMFGYATDETEQMLPLPLVLAHGLTKALANVRKQGRFNYLRPDGKAQVSVEYDDGVPLRVTCVVLSTQHSEGVSYKELESDMLQLIKEVIPSKYLDGSTKFYVNPTGRFVVGGPSGDSGLTGRKIIVDTYGGFAKHGGGAFSGKDPTKVDRSASYYARYIAKNVVAAGLAKRCEIAVAYAIGKSRPVSVSVDTFSTGSVPDDILAGAIEKTFDMRPYSIIKELDLRRGIYYKTAQNGHFSCADFPWERTDRAEDLKRNISK